MSSLDSMVYELTDMKILSLISASILAVSRDIGPILSPKP